MKLEVKGPPIIENTNKVQNFDLNSKAEIQCEYSTTSKIASMVIFVEIQTNIYI